MYLSVAKIPKYTKENKQRVQDPLPAQVKLNTNNIQESMGHQYCGTCRLQSDVTTYCPSCMHACMHAVRHTCMHVHLTTTQHLANSMFTSQVQSCLFQSTVALGQSAMQSHSHMSCKREPTKTSLALQPISHSTSYPYVQQLARESLQGSATLARACMQSSLRCSLSVLCGSAMTLTH